MSLRAYGIQIWRVAKPSNIQTIQAFHSICLRLLSSASEYVINNNLYKDLNAQYFIIIFKTFYSGLHTKLQSHTNSFISKLLTIILLDNLHHGLKENGAETFLSSM